ncbi:BlaR1 peptidase M56 [Cohnella sp. SGD-V74]|uniref:M56 family metallopeptidase n=1 Tax=unclassified Cohnella TaxID=2636738 RepID=UPI000D40E16C|nr:MULTISPECIES: M56 family metallopeptidase [unclassified Cohnella]PRX65060.1 BlaR1 peptidase M56 [Cohnella sp. SGD-V74]
MPRQPMMALIWIILIGLWATVQMTYILVHQLSDITLELNLFLVIRSIIIDTFSNHVLWELLLNLSVLFSCLIFCKQLIQQAKLYRQWERYIKTNKNDEMSKQLRELLKCESIRIEVITEQKMMAMTIGFLRPRIVLSSRMLERFSKDELISIVYHELYHYQFRHPLQRFVLTIIAECFAFLPIVKGLVQYYKVWMELLADRYAIYRAGSEFHLAQVLLKIIKSEQSHPHAYGVHLADESVNYRLQQLIDPKSELNMPIFEWKAFLPSTFILSVMTIVILLGCI